MKESEKHLTELVNRCMVFADRRGKVLEKGSNPFSSWLKMRYSKKGLLITFHAQCSPHSNGSCRVEVEENGKTVLEASGNFMTAAFNVAAKTYVPGDWEKKVVKLA